MAQAQLAQLTQPRAAKPGDRCLIFRRALGLLPQGPAGGLKGVAPLLGQLVEQVAIDAELADLLLLGPHLLPQAVDDVDRVGWRLAEVRLTAASRLAAQLIERAQDIEVLQVLDLDGAQQLFVLGPLGGPDARRQRFADAALQGLGRLLLQLPRCRHAAFNVGGRCPPSACIGVRSVSDGWGPAARRDTAAGDGPRISAAPPWSIPGPDRNGSSASRVLRSRGRGPSGRRRLHG